jgi:signal transduction histidine kinase
MLSLYLLIVYSSILINIIIISFLIKKIKTNRLLWLLIGLQTAMLLWAIKNLLVFYNLIAVKYYYAFSRFSDILAIFILIILFYFFYYSFKPFKKQYLVDLLLFLSSIILAGLILFDPGFYNGYIVDKNFGYDDLPGTGKYIYLAWIVLLFFSIIYIIFRSWRNAKNKNKKDEIIKIRIIGAWAIFSIIFAIITEIILPNFFRITLPLGAFSANLFSIAVVYAMYNFSFLNVRVKKQKIFYKLLYSFLFFAMIAIFFPSFFLYQKSAEALKERSMSQLASVAELKVNQLEFFIEEAKQELILTSRDEKLTENLAQHFNNIESDTHESIHEDSRLDLIKKLEKELHFSEFFILDIDGYIHLSTDIGQEGKIRSQEDYFIKGKLGPFIKSFFYSLSYQKPDIIISVPVIDGAGNLIAVLAGRINMDYINKIMSDLSVFGESGETILINGNNYMVSNSRFLSEAVLKKYIDTAEIVECKNKNNGGIEYIDYRGIPVFGEYRWVENLNVCLVAKIDQEEAFLAGKELFKHILLILPLVLFILIIISLLVARNITRPIKALIKATKNLAATTKNDEKIVINSNDEMADLAGALNWAKEELKIAREKEAAYSNRLEKEVKDRTEELNIVLLSMKADKEKMQQQRLATLNVLEDVSDSQKDLEKTYRELEKKNEEINTLKNLSQDLSGVLDVEEAIHIITKHIESNFSFFGITFLIYEIFDSGIIYRNHLIKETCSKCLDESRKDLERHIKKNDKKYASETISIIQNVKPRYTGAKINDYIKKNSTKSKFDYYSLVSGDINFGLIQIAKKDDIIISKSEKDLLDAIISAFVMALERLRTIVLAQQSKTVSLVESLKDGVIMFNTNEDLVIMNKAFSRYTGFSNEYFSLKDLYRLIADHEVSDMVKASIVKGQISNITDVKLINKYYEIIILPVRDNKDNIVGGAIIFHDITRLKEIDQMKTEFVSVASHQLRTPLTAIKLFTEMLVKEQVGKLKKEQKEYLENIFESTERMVRLVNDLLNVSRIESGRLRVDPHPLKIIEFFETIIAEAKPLSDLKKQKIIFNKNIKNNFEVPLDKNLIRQVFHNLIVNAIRYSPKKKGKVEIKLSKDDDNLLVSVKDNGIGIPEKAQRRIFEKFFRAENAVITITEGTGLGLYVSKMIVVSSNGKIWFESKKGKGTCFYVSLPLIGMKEKKGERGLAIS